MIAAVMDFCFGFLFLFVVVIRGFIEMRLAVRDYKEIRKSLFLTQENVYYQRIISERKVIPQCQRLHFPTQ